MSEEYTKQRIPRRRGRTLSFYGKLLCSTDFPSRDGLTTTVLELWQTPEGRWVAVTSFEKDIPGGGNRDTAHAVVIEPSSDEVARQDAALDFWEWHAHARSMVKSQLRWNLTVQVA